MILQPKSLILGIGVVVFGLLASASLWAADEIRFPPDFKWCVATAAHQIEGGNVNSDWWEFEQVPGHIKGDEPSGAAADSWNLIDKDLALMKFLKIKEYRFSVEWAKIEPQPGKISKSAVAHYRSLVKLLLANGIEPMITLHHFTFPKWVRDLGGWGWAGTPAAFQNYTTIVHQEIGPEVRDWITVNEPMPHLLGGYLAGVVPPGLTGPPSILQKPLVGMMKSHAASYHELHRLAHTTGREVRVGIAHHIRTFDPKIPFYPLDVILSSVAQETWNWSIPDSMMSGRLKFNIFWALNVDEEIPRLDGTQDFFGLNYYTGDLLYWDMFSGPQKTGRNDLAKNDMGWDIYPEGLGRVLREIHKRYPTQSIFITENGTADSKDAFRSQFLVEHLKQVALAQSNGIPIEGFCEWSLLDNFEWDSGFGPRFGLYEVDYKTKKRIPRQSAETFRKIASENALPIALPPAQ